MKTLRRFLTSLRYARRRQLLARARLFVRRRVLAATAPFVPLERRLRKRGDVREARDLPLPLFDPRRHFVRYRGADAWAQLPGAEIELRVPLDWGVAHAPELGRDGARASVHFMEFLEEVGDDDFMALIDDWIERCPPYSSRAWNGGWSSHALSIRTLVWMQQWAVRRARLERGFVERMRRSIVSQLRYLLENLEFDVGGHRLIKNVKALLWGSRCFDGAEPSHWRQCALRLLAEELEEQVLADGMHYERSHSHHLQVFADLLEIQEVLDTSPLQDGLTQKLHAMAQAACDLTHPDGRVSLFNDSGLHAGYYTEDCLRVYSAVTGRQVAARGLFSLSSSGFFGVRKGGDMLVVDCGDIGPDDNPGHGHGDALSFEWTVGGRRIIVDAGVAEYTPGKLRDWSRSTRAHNTVTLDDVDQCDFYSSFGVARRARVSLARMRSDVDSFLLEGSHTGYRHLGGAPTVFRRFSASPTRIEVTDWVDGGDGQDVRARLLLHPEAKVHVRKGKATIVRGRTLIRVHTSAEISIVRGYWSPDFGICTPTQQIEFAYGNAPCLGSFQLETIPSKRRAPYSPDDYLRIEADPAPGPHR